MPPQAKLEDCWLVKPAKSRLSIGETRAPLPDKEAADIAPLIPPPMIRASYRPWGSLVMLLSRIVRTVKFETLGAEREYSSALSSFGTFVIARTIAFHILREQYQAHGKKPFERIIGSCGNRTDLSRPHTNSYPIRVYSRFKISWAQGAFPQS